MTRTRVRRPGLTRAQLAATVPAGPDRCLCPAGPTTVATFRDGDLVDVQKRHLLAHRCGRPTEHIDPRTYQADIRTRC